MIGHSVEFGQVESDRDLPDETALELKSFAVDMPGEVLKEASVKIRKGEIFGFAGLAGHGKAAIANGIIGLYPSQGEVYLNGEKLDLSDTLSILKKNVAFVSEDRRGVGLLLDESIERNTIATSLRVKDRYLKKVLGIKFYDHGSAKEFTDKMIKEFDIRCTGANQAVGRLSGGNQQKVCMARAVASDPELLLVSEPTRGIDVGAKKRILDTLVELNRDKGVTVVVTSSELAELRSVCDRIAVVSGGRIIGILKPYDESYKFGLYMSGIKEEDR